MDETLRKRRWRVNVEAAADAYGMYQASATLSYSSICFVQIAQKCFF